MAKFGRKSEEKLAALHPKMVRVLRLAIRLYDFAILETHRTKETHEKYIAAGKTKVPYEKTKHRHSPSMAVDLAPYPIVWPESVGGLKPKIKAAARFYFVAGAILMAGMALGVKLRWGGDWDGDTDFNDQTFDDLVHFELKEGL